MFMIPTVAVMTLLALVKPLADRQTNRMEVYNSFTLLCIAYCLLCFTPFAADPGARYQIGFALVFLTCQNIVVNIAIVSR